MFSQNFPGARGASVWPVISDRKLSDIGPIYASAHQITQGLFPFPRITLSVPGKVASPCVGSATKKLFLTKSDRIFRSTLSATGCISVFINFNSKCWMHRTYMYMCSFFSLQSVGHFRVWYLLHLSKWVGLLHILSSLDHLEQLHSHTSWFWQSWGPTHGVQGGKR